MTIALGQHIELSDFRQRCIHAVVAKIIPQLGRFEQFDRLARFNQVRPDLARIPQRRCTLQKKIHQFEVHRSHSLTERYL